MTDQNQKIAVTIAGNDSDGSAGMPADLHSFYARGVYGMGLLTAAVAGNTKGIFAQQVMPLDFIQKQFDVLADDFTINAAKTGMVADSKVMNVVADNLEKYDFGKIVIDPVISTKHGNTLMDDDSYNTFIKRLVPLADIITPNFYEQKKLTGLELNDLDEVKKGAKMLQDMGAKNVLMKGRHDGEQTEVTDILLTEDGKFHAFTKPYFKTDRVNGTGDTLSAVIAAELAKGNDLIDIDFYLPEHSKAIQVTWELSETDKKREISNLVKLHQTNPEIKDLIIVTAEDEDEIQVGDCKIQVIPVYKFLLKN